MNRWLAPILLAGAALALYLPAQQLSPASAPDPEILPNGMEVIPVAITPGPVEPTWKSLGDHFKTPTWWRHAKIGVWLHWGPQSVGEDGDWYAKWIYMPKYAWDPFTNVYQHHLERFGHPSTAGYKDILPLWHAQNWHPEELMALYKRAGARYVIAQGMHHDNFDLWDSKYQPWNSVNIGPHRSIVGGWKQAADHQGMRFGIAFHGDYALWWYQPAFLSDVDGPQKGVPYDGAQPHPGNNEWWQKQDLNLRDLYGIDLKDEVTVPPDWKGTETEYRMSDPLKHGIPEVNLQHHHDFATWFATKWTNRVMDAVHQFSPDFIYFDGGDSYPFCGTFTGKGLRADATPRVIADLYNQSIATHQGQLEAMAFTKGNEDPRAIAVNVESRVPDQIKRDQPWQTETGLGQWFYQKGTFYDAGMVIHDMLEAVSRDGNYVINIPLTPAGELDPGGRKVLEQMGKWMDVNREGIYDSSAWDIWGEGQVVMKPGNLGPEQARTPYTAADIRYTTRNQAVYAYAMAWPANRRLTLHALSSTAGAISKVSLLGSNQALAWHQTPEGLIVTLPAKPPCSFAYGLKISGVNLHAPANSGQQ